MNRLEIGYRRNMNALACKTYLNNKQNEKINLFYGNKNVLLDNIMKYI